MKYPRASGALRWAPDPMLKRACFARMTLLHTVSNLGLSRYCIFMSQITSLMSLMFDYAKPRMFIQGRIQDLIRGGAPDRDRPKTAILGPQFCRILVLGPRGGGPGPPGPPPWMFIPANLVNRIAFNLSEITLGHILQSPKHSLRKTSRWIHCGISFNLSYTCGIKVYVMHTYLLCPVDIKDNV